jgi:ATP-dependent DNA helicase RecG
MPVVQALTEQQLLEAVKCGEERDWEFKNGRGGLPDSLWHTYSAMANTDGGCIVVGVEQQPGGFLVSGVPDAGKMKQDFWNAVNNRNKASLNLLTDQMVTVEQLAGQRVLVIRVPRATRQQRPVFVGLNPLTGTYRRNFEGDYHCTENEVGRMLADRSDEPADSRILEGFGISDLDEPSLQQYRQRFSARSPAHPWLAEELPGFLAKLGAWRRDRTTGQEELTVAGLLMFGKVESIRDPQAVPEFNLDYRERLSDDPQTRWTDRLTWDGTWVANVFQFYQRVIQRLTADLKIPFQLQANLFRKDDTVVHEAIREALVNALIHADYRGQGGIVVEKHKDRFEMSNPGTLLVSIEQLLRGGVSECRNKSLQQMFLMIGGGERAGSGIDKMRQGWASQKWRAPSIQESVQPDRVRLVLPMVSLLPGESLKRLRDRFGGPMDGLGPLETQALVTAEVEGGVTNARMQEISSEHPADLTKLLQGLVGRSFLVQDGQKRWSSYRLPPLPAFVRSAESASDSAHNARTPHIKVGDSAHKIADSLRSLSEERREQLRAIAASSQPDSRLKPDTMRRLILDLCQGVYLTAADLADLLSRNPNSLRLRFLTPMVADGLLQRKYPHEPNRPDQAYTTKKAAGES